MTSTSPSAAQAKRAVGLDPVERSRRDLLLGAEWTVSRVPTGCARASHACANASASLSCATDASSRAKLPASKGANACGSRTPFESRGVCVRQLGAEARLTPKPTTTRSPLRSSRMPRKLGRAAASGRSAISASAAGPGSATSTASISARPAASESDLRGRIARLKLRQACCRRNCPLR